MTKEEILEENLGRDYRPLQKNFPVQHQDILRTMSTYAEQQATLFADWKEKKVYRRNIKGLWFDSLNDQSNSQCYTTSELYQLFSEDQLKK